MMKISAVDFMWNTEICQDAPNHGQDDLVLPLKPQKLSALLEVDHSFSQTFSKIYQQVASKSRNFLIAPSIRGRSDVIERNVENSLWSSKSV
jgi:hypothetical protein